MTSSILSSLVISLNITFSSSWFTTLSSAPKKYLCTWAWNDPSTTMFFSNNERTNLSYSPESLMFSSKRTVSPFPLFGHGHMFSCLSSCLISNELKTDGKSLAHLFLSLTFSSLNFCAFTSASSASCLVVSVVSWITSLSAISDFSSTVVMVLVRESIWVVVDLFSSSAWSSSESTFSFPPLTASGSSEPASSTSSILSSPSSSFSSAFSSSVSFPLTGGAASSFLVGALSACLVS